jgi:UDP-glucose 4-epimerase
MDIERIVYSSTRAVYGKLKGEFAHPTYKPVPEEAVFPVGSHFQAYAAAKFLMENTGLRYVDLGVDFIALRFGATYGPGKMMTHGDSKPTGIPTMIVANALKGKASTIPKGGEGKMDFVYYKDVASGILKACYAENFHSRIFNISIGEGYSLHDWAEVIHKLFLDIKLTIGSGNFYDLGLQGGILDITKARKELSYQPKYTLDKGIKDFIQEINRLGLN